MALSGARLTVQTWSSWYGDSHDEMRRSYDHYIMAMPVPGRRDLVLSRGPILTVFHLIISQNLTLSA